MSDTPLIEAIEKAIERNVGLTFDGQGRAWVSPASIPVAAQAALTAITEAGYVICPREPTEAMLERGRWEAESCTNDWTCAAACLPGHVYSSMISAAQGDGA